MDPIVDQADSEAVAGLTDRELARLIDLLDTIRAANAERGAARNVT